MCSVFLLTSNRLEQAVSCHNNSNIDCKFAFLCGNEDLSISIAPNVGKIFSKLVCAWENSIADIFVDIMLEI